MLRSFSPANVVAPQDDINKSAFHHTKQEEDEATPTRCVVVWNEVDDDDDDDDDDAQGRCRFFPILMIQRWIEASGIETFSVTF